MDNYIVFLFILVGTAVGWMVGYKSGHQAGYIMANMDGLFDSPIINVEMDSVGENTYLFYHLLSGEFIIKGSVQDCNDRILEEIERDNPEAEIRIIYSMKVSEHE